MSGEGNLLLSDLLKLKKVGAKSKQVLNGLGIYRICDLLHYYPRAYEKVETIVPIVSLLEGELAYIEVEVDSEPALLRLQRGIMVQCKVSDESGKLTLVYYNQVYMKKVLQQGETYILKGKLSIKNGRKFFANPQIIKPEEYEKLLALKLKPIYALTKDLSLKKMTDYIEQVLELMKTEMVDYLGEDLRRKYQLATLSYAYEKIHYPVDDVNLELARKRLVFDEFLLFLLAIRQVKERVRRNENLFVMERHPKIKRFMEELPFRLTQAQASALDDMFGDFSSEYSMTRLVQGDVGSGKTIIATIGLLNACLHGYQSAFMAPTEVLAKQHYHSLHTLLEPYGLRVELLIGSTGGKKKTEIYEGLSDGSIDLIIGTHALIQEKVEFANLAFIVTDEQHRFGVLQREELVNKGRMPHTLVMSATPIPRSLALILYGDLDISIVNELPAGRKKIETYLVNSSYRERMYEFVLKEVQAGRNAYFICPMVEDNEKMENLESVTSYAQRLREFFPEEIRIGVLHGRMKGKEKTDMMESFLSYETQILVSTTVIEVGVNVPNATMMVIENADRFGLSQLHQLRGRVGRSDLQSYCILVSDTKSKETKEKLKFLKDHEDGFEISEYDLKVRGPGDAFGTKQHGSLFFKLADIYQDKELLQMANEVAETILVDERVEEQLDMFYYELTQDIAL